MNIKTFLPLATIAVAAALVVPAAEIDDKVNAALEADIRTEAERVRDANRMPLETLKFFGLTDDMQVLELFPGGGWYTKVLGAGAGRERSPRRVDLHPERRRRRSRGRAGTSTSFRTTATRPWKAHDALR